jgi:hypothetical protein
MVLRRLTTNERRVLCVALAAGTIAAGLVLRLVRLGIPLVVVRYGGSVLWAVMVYLLIAALIPRQGSWRVAQIAGFFAAVVELSRLYHTAAFDAFRMTTTGALLLGRVFNPWHFVAYWAAIAVTAMAGGLLLRREP